jgi:hypothetical protein
MAVAAAMATQAGSVHPSAGAMSRCKNASISVLFNIVVSRFRDKLFSAGKSRNKCPVDQTNCYLID